MMAPRRLLVIQHEDACPPGWFEPWLADAGVTLEVVPAHRGSDVPDDLGGRHGLLVLGGQMSAGDDATCPWLPPTKALIAAVVTGGQPFLGICLGHQLAAVALGGEVARNPRGTTRGVVPVSLTDAGRGDVLLGAHDGDPSVHWNGDVAVTLPHDAVALATAPDGTVQAARFGARAWGVQFHPEATPGIVAGWVTDRPGAEVPEKITAALAEVTAAERRLCAAWAPLARRFADVLDS